MLPFGSFSYTSSTHIPTLVILVFLVFPRAPLFLVCCLGHSPHVSQTVAEWLHLTGGKQAQDPPGSLHTVVSPVEWSSLKGRSPRWFTVRKTTCFTKMPLVTISGHVISLTLLLSLLCSSLLPSSWCFLALHRVPVSSNWFFVWDSLRSSTRLLVRNHSGFCSHWYLAGPRFFLSTSFYRLCFCLSPCFSFKWFCSFWWSVGCFSLWVLLFS